LVDVPNAEEVVESIENSEVEEHFKTPEGEIQSVKSEDAEVGGNLKEDVTPKYDYF
jgi:hypothetical protein